eukprot:TRINITY_DN8645_c0_g1_i4.p1 TRINITY_DN8645_c0_g1~~TRINITY_DN8645_c0_g1_i4.p1  ORF type:complete len:227 (+),score=-9.94 TRINITY_DN8645_c0_g1_i4:199-879(+)
MPIELTSNIQNCNKSKTFLKRFSNFQTDNKTRNLVLVMFPDYRSVTLANNCAFHVRITQYGVTAVRFYNPTHFPLPLFLTWPLLKECQKITTVCLTLVLLYTMVQQQMQIQVLQEIIYKQNILTLTQLKKQGSTETLMYYFLKFIYTKKLEYSCKIHQNIFITITTVKQSLLNKFNNVLVLFLQPLPKKATRIENRRPYPNFFEKIFKFQIPFSSFSKLSDTPTIN